MNTKEQTPLERAIAAVVKHILGDDIPDDEHTCCVAVAKRELEEAVPHDTDCNYYKDDSEVGALAGNCNCFRKAFLGE